MKVTVPAKDFSDAVGWTAKFTAPNPTLPAMSGLLIDATGDAIVLTAQDASHTGRRTVGGTIHTPGKVLVSSRLFADLVNKLPGDVDLELAREDDQFVVRADGSRFRLRVMNTDDFPKGHAAGPSASVVVVDGHRFADVVSRVAPAAAAQDARPVLGGVNVQIGNGRLLMVATDTYRLAVESLECSAGAPDGASLIPAKSLAAAARATSGQDQVSIALDASAFEIAAGDVRVSGSLLEGTYPQWQALMPDGQATEMVVGAAGLQEALDRFLVLNAATKSAIPVLLNMAPGSQLEVTAESVEHGDGLEHVVAQMTGEPLKIAFNPTFLNDALSAVPTPQVRLQFRDELKPALLTPADETESDLRIVLMPMRV